MKAEIPLYQLSIFDLSKSASLISPVVSSLLPSLPRLFSTVNRKERGPKTGLGIASAFALSCLSPCMHYGDLAARIFDSSGTQVSVAPDMCWVLFVPFPADCLFQWALAHRTHIATLGEKLT